MNGWVLILDPDPAVQALVQLVRETRRIELSDQDADRHRRETQDERDRRELVDCR